MKVNSVKGTMRPNMINNNRDTTLDTHMNVNRIPSHRDNVHYLVKVFGEKELKRFGILECKTCSRRITNNKAKNSDDAHEGQDKNSKSLIHICKECGRIYAEDGETNIVKLGQHIYDPGLELFEGFRLDEKI